ncbi:MAG: phosphotransferase, partial [Actinomycetota bacterium]
MTSTVARSAAEAVVRERCGNPRVLDAGRSSTAWVVDSTSGRWVVRVPIPNSGRLLSYRSEAHLGDLLTDAGHPVASWTVVEVEDTWCSVGPLLPGRPLDDHADFGPDFASALGRLLGDTHALPTEGFGPLVDVQDRLHGRSDSV